MRATQRLRFIACLCSGALLAACSTVPYERPAEPRSSQPASKPAPAGAAQAPGVLNPPVTTQKGGGFYKDDGPGENIPPNLADIPDAVPRVEPIRAANTRPYAALGQTFTPLKELQPFSQTGIGSWYGKKFHGAKTSSGERYDMYGMTAAHPTLPIPSYARVTNLANNRSVVVRVNDRGPFLHSRIIDLSYAAAWKLGYVNQGSARLQVDLIVPDELDSLIAAAPATPETEPAPPSASASAPAAVAVAPSPAAPTVDSPANVDSGIFLQLGAFASSANADSFRDYVQGELKWLQHAVQTRLIGDKYRLHVGPFASASEARGVGERIAAAIRVQPFVVTR
ncbi:septal ring lytic transglycosylase RlpA family protein [Uliginosibacterium sp. 31-16]|uniref:septal ring lytic transglycosylase RlpA family protein n=1 Tax=Uliginosibacterium sp. 31-16 TaxID=3068315 RepID=UPI00273E2C4E|nr:septal ring lytic transglycosylase RlpA family protein [Uliginosibacterium sp. 31-16]MDP5238675.1 septal ring lytic transglycosylase RlpA family protein [Uliginosibacterium sp. 31-16]